jgi:hypothetical protein
MIITESPELTRVSELIPGYFRSEVEKFTELMEDYYRFLNESGPTGVLNSLVTEHDLYSASEQYLIPIHNTIASYIPDAALDDRTLMKQIVRYFYNNRGSTESAEVFFRIFFDVYASVSFPVADELISQTGNVPVDAKNVLYWKPYSYIIRTELDISRWEIPYKELIHPIGFGFYALVFISTFHTNYWTDQYISADAFRYKEEDITRSWGFIFNDPSLWFSQTVTGLGGALIQPGSVYTLEPGHTPFSQPGWVYNQYKFLEYLTIGYEGRIHYDYDYMLKFSDRLATIDFFKDYTIGNADTIPTGHVLDLAYFGNVSALITAYFIGGTDLGDSESGGGGGG